MCSARAFSGGGLLLLVQLLLAAVLLCDVVSAQGSGSDSRWQTLNGDPPLVVARGGFAGLLPDSSAAAYNLALVVSLPNVILWCDVQLTKDGVGICFPDIKLENASNIADVYKNKEKSYSVNGLQVRGWFPIDYTFEDLTQVILTQGVYSRTNKFDGNLFTITTVEDMATQLKPPGLWLNVQHDAFYQQHNLSMRSYVLSVSRKVVVNYISSPELNFLSGIASRFNPSITKLVFRFMKKTNVEPTTNQTYDSLLKNLTFVKTFASGILIPKDYIWPIDSKLYLQSHTSVVTDAHKAGLEVFTYDFSNDVPYSYNFSYDPVAEYLHFFDNGDFAVDGVLSDFPITPSAAIDCFSHIGRNASNQVNLTIISKNGASGDYPGCTDLAYNKAITDGVDFIDCPVQMSKDGIPFCSNSINLIDGTNAIQSNFSSYVINIPELMPTNGIFAFNLTWDEIQTLKPSISTPYTRYRLSRNPSFENAGKLLTLADFVGLAKNASTLSGVTISIEKAPYLAERQGLAVTDAVLKVLNDAALDKQVWIQSTNSSVLKKFKDSSYETVYEIEEPIRSADNGSLDDIESFAKAVVVKKASVFPLNQAFISGKTDVVTKIQSFKLPVYVELFSNEFVAQAWDFFSDATVELNTFVNVAGINGVITEYPKTADRYRKNRCLSKKQLPSYMTPVEPASLLQLVTSQFLPPAAAPNPVLTESDVAESPLPTVTVKPANSPGNGTALAPTPPNGQTRLTGSMFLSSLAMLFFAGLLLF